jgi:hypothetical protein
MRNCAQYHRMCAKCTGRIKNSSNFTGAVFYRIRIIQGKIVQGDPSYE